MKLTTRWIMVLASLMLVIGVVPAQAAPTIFNTGLGTLDANKAGPKLTTLTPLEGGDETIRSGLMMRINPTTVIILSPGDDRALETADDGVWHCYKLGTTSQTCDFFATGSVLPRRPILVNGTTAVVLSGGSNDVKCESLSEGDGTPDDVLIVFRKLGGSTATVELVDGAGLGAAGLCLGNFASDPIRINNNTLLFAQPGVDLDWGDPEDDSACPAGIDNDDTIVMARIGTSSTTLKEIASPTFLSGGPATTPVRVSDAIAVISSPGDDSQFADADGCDTGDDGFVVVKGLTGSTPTASFFEIGSLAANPHSRPVLVNPGKAVVVLGTGPNHSQQEQELEDAGSDPVLAATSDDEIIVVKNLSGAPGLDTFSGFGHMRRPQMLSSTTAVALEEDQSLVLGDPPACCFGSDEEEEVRLNLHRIKGIGATPSLVTLPMPSGDAFHREAHFAHSTGVPMNANQMLFAVTGPPQVFLLTDGASPKLSSLGGNADDWAEVKITKLSAILAAYTRAKEKGIGAIKIGAGGAMDHRLVTVGGGNSPSHGPVAISPYRFVVASGGSNGEFADDSDPEQNGHDDGFIVVNTFTWPPKFNLIQVRNSCGGPGCQPLALGSASAPMVAILGVGDNGEFDNDGDETDDDDELNVVKGF